MWISKKKWEYLVNKIGSMNNRLLELEYDTAFHDISTITINPSSGLCSQSHEKIDNCSRRYTYEELKYYKTTSVKKVLEQLMDSLGYEIVIEPEKRKEVKVSKIDVTKL